MIEHHQLLAMLPAAGFTDIDASRDAENSISSRVVRGRLTGRPAVAVTGETKTQISALLDLVDLCADNDTGHGWRADDATLVFTGDEAGEVAAALGTLASSVVDGPTIHLLRLAPDGSLTPMEAQPADVADATAYRYLRWLGLLTAVGSPPQHFLDLVDRTGREELRAYPMLSKDGRWSLRVEGLEVARLGGAKEELGVGRDGADGRRSGPRRLWVDAASTTAPIPLDGTEQSIGEAARVLRRFAAAWNPSDPTDPGGAQQDEHVLESRVLRGAVPLKTPDGATLQLLRSGEELSPPDRIVNWGSQFPTRWGPTTSPGARYLDALLRDGETPWALELKVEKSSGVGGYYRHGIGQAVLYRHFIQAAAPLKPWFDHYGLAPATCRAGIVLPHLSGTRQHRWHTRLERICRAFDVATIWVDPAYARRRALGH